jgi:hypothetical protein
MSAVEGAKAEMHHAGAEGAGFHERRSTNGQLDASS